MERDANGFTLIELLVVVVIIGILATFAAAQFGEVRRQAFRSAVVSDLKNLAIEQELYHGRLSAYGELSGLPDFHESAGVTVQLTARTESGWAATATHEGIPDVQCGIFVGSATAADAPPATSEGDIACTQ